MLLITGISSNYYPQENSKLFYGAEYLFPVADDRNIKTVNLDVYFTVLEFRQINLSVLAGGILTYATGDITQLEGELEEGTLREVNYKNSAFGIGPGALMDLNLPVSSEFSIHFEGAGNIILYSEGFPAGGDQYNFMWRSGPLLQYEFTNSVTANLGYHRSHVSNGQGLVSENPSYNAEGVSVRFSGLF